MSQKNDHVVKWVITRKIRKTKQKRVIDIISFIAFLSFILQQLINYENHHHGGLNKNKVKP